MRRELIVAIHDFLVDSHRVVVVEGRVASEHLEHEDAEGPPVHILVVTLRLDDLGCQVLRRSAKCVSLVLDNLGETEISDADVAFSVNEEVLRLEIAVGDVHSVEVLEGEEDLAREEKGHVVGETTFASQQSEKFATAGVVKQHVDVRWRLEVPLQVHDEWMVDDREDFLLTLDVVDLFQFNDRALFQALQRHWL